MQSTVFIFAAVVAITFAQVYRLPSHTERYPDNWFGLGHNSKGMTWETRAGKGHVFGTLGGGEGFLSGTGGYRQEIFNDHRGRLQAEGYGTRVLGAAGDSTIMGGRMDWSGDHAKVAADLHREIGGKTGVSVAGEGVWKLDKNTKLSAGGNFDKTFGHEKPDLGVQATIEHNF